MSYEGQDDLISLSLNGKPYDSLYEPAADDHPPEVKRRLTISSGILAVGYLAAFLAIVTGILTGLTFHTIHARLTQWPRVQASIDFCENYHVQTRRTGGDHSYVGFEYGFRCQVTYTPQSLVHHSLLDIGYKSSDPNEMAQWALRIHRGDSVPVVYDPSDFTRVRFADSHASYAPALHALHFVIGTFLVSLALITFGRMLRPAKSTETM